MNYSPIELIQRQMNGVIENMCDIQAINTRILLSIGEDGYMRPSLEWTDQGAKDLYDQSEGLLLCLKKQEQEFLHGQIDPARLEFMLNIAMTGTGLNMLSVNEDGSIETRVINNSDFFKDPK